MTLPELTRDSTEITYIPSDKRCNPYTVLIKDLTLDELESIVIHQVLNGYIVPSLVIERLTELLPSKVYKDR